jgi:uncharacterized protein (DUF433 family)
MGKFDSLISQRAKKRERSPKMAALAKQSAHGNLSSFSGVFSLTELNQEERSKLEAILDRYSNEDYDNSEDLESLISITSEVKAINNQAAILHGERIKRAQAILKEYEEGAFSAWLVTTYGNRQTPYNFLQYFEFCECMPKTLQQQVEAMPRQAVYTLASRKGSFDKKQKIVKDYDGQTKDELIEIIREEFPLDQEDKRRKNEGEAAVQKLKQLCSLIERKRVRLSKGQRQNMSELIDQLNRFVKR